MWYLLLNNRAFCIYLFLCKASLPTCRGSTDKAASNSWILETAVFKFGLRFLGAAYSYRLPPASTGLRFHSRCSHMPYPTYWHMAGGGGESCQGKLKMQDTLPANPFPPKSQPPHIQQRITRGKKQNLRFWKRKRSFLDTVCATTIVTWDKLEKALRHHATEACQKQSSPFLFRATVLGYFSLLDCKFLPLVY